MRWIVTIALVHAGFFLSAQQNSQDSSRLLREIVIEAYGTDRQLSEVPASIGFLKANDLQRFSNTSILPAVNIIPGVRMEERSPGSFRFSIRGSSLRAPFGVRNVKAYWNGLPLTDGGGNTYLNLLDFGAIGTLEVIKGPGGSLYGAGTGGVILLKSPEIKQNQLQATAIAGSYGLQRYVLGGQLKGENVSANVQLAHHSSDGYREQTALKRNGINADIKMRVGKKGTLSPTIFFSDLFYETPGGLNKVQFDQDPQQARPPSASLGAVEAKAAVTNKTIFGGLVYDYDWNEQWTTTVGVYGAFSAFENPTIRNYEDRDETNLGVRSYAEYKFNNSQAPVDGKITFGGEFQHFKSPIAVFDNDGVGNAGNIQVRDEVTSKLGLFFAQADLRLPYDFFITAGASINFLQYHFARIEPTPVLTQERSFEAVFSPRIAVLKKFTETLSLYGSYSDGFSPPSLAEVRPSTSTFNNSLKSESGNNLEFGVRGNLLKKKLKYDLMVYDFKLRNTIVVQRNDEGADYFVNAGKTSQRGVEALVSFDVASDKDLFSLFKVWGSYAYQHYRFKEYVVLEESFAGNKLTGVAPSIFSGGLDMILKKRISANFTLNYVDHIPLDDANSAFAEAYLLLGLRAGWKTTLAQNHLLEFFGGIDNALDETYSLGNDLNAFGGRYYNAAMPRNFYAGISVVLGSKK